MMVVQRAYVPCGSCRLCCTNDLILLHEECGDDPATFDCEPAPIGEGLLSLKRKPNGECTYLGPDGCTIHDRAPAVCKEFDCRRFFLSMTRTERRQAIKKGLASKEVFEAGRKRLASLHGQAV